MRLFATTLVLLGVAFCANVTALADEEMIPDEVLLKGKVVNADGKPLGGAKIVIHNEDTRKDQSGKSNGDGDFEIEHEKCSFLSFYVFPPSEKSGLTTAHYSHVVGELSKHYIVKLHHGFRVTGRILAEGQGVKGLEIKAISRDGDGTSTIHGGGLTHTRGDGEYTLLLTPGKKSIQIKNEIFSNLAPLYEHEFTITGDTRLPDMTLPLTKEK
jgi:hypothetical protein